MLLKQRVCEVEHGHFTLLIFTSIEGMSDATSHAHRTLANLLSDKMDLMRR